MVGGEASSTPTSSSKVVTLKLLVDTKSNRVLFAEAGKDFVDFLFNTLSLPLGTIIRVIQLSTKNEQIAGSLRNLYESIESLDDDYILPNQHKDNLLKPKSAVPNLADRVPLLPLDYSTAAAPAQRTFYRCSHCNAQNLSGNPDVVCRGCYRMMSLPMTYVEQPAPKVDHQVVAASSGGGEAYVNPAPAHHVAKAASEGFVKGLVTYMIMDDLAVMPLSTISSITLLNRFNVENVCSLEERIVEVGMNEGVKLLKESLQSKRVLTNVFLDKKTSVKYPDV